MGDIDMINLSDIVMRMLWLLKHVDLVKGICKLIPQVYNYYGSGSKTCLEDSEAYFKEPSWKNSMAQYDCPAPSKWGHMDYHDWIRWGPYAGAGKILGTSRQKVWLDEHCFVI